jgi:hypothetical protein
LRGSKDKKREDIMRSNVLVSILVICVVSPLFAYEHFVSAVGEYYEDQGYSVVQTQDGGFAVAGRTLNFGAAPNFAVMLSKFDAEGVHLWTRTLMGDAWDEGRSIDETSDGGLVVAGFSSSFPGGYNAILSKFDASGTHLWTKTIGGDLQDEGYAVLETADGGIVLGGSMEAISYELLLTKLDSAGAHLWTTTLSSLSSVEAYAVVQTQDGGFAATGYLMGGAGSHDALLSRFDASGNHLWTKTIGGSDWDEGWSVTETGDGGFAVAGFTVSAGAGGYDAFLSKLDATGGHLWTRTLGGSDTDWGRSVTETSDGSLVVTGYARSFGGGSDDLFLSKFTQAGTHVWTTSVGGLGNGDEGWEVIESADGRLIVAGKINAHIPFIEDLAVFRFDTAGTGCLGTSVSPTVLDWTPAVATPVINVHSPTPTISTVDPTVTAPDPIYTAICPLCGDANNDLDVTTGDAYMILNYLGSAPQPAYCWSANVNGDSGITPSDGYHLLNYFGSGTSLNCQECEF